MGQAKNQILGDEFSRSIVMAGRRIDATPQPQGEAEEGDGNIHPVADVLATGIRNKLPDADSLIFGKQNENR